MVTSTPDYAESIAPSGVRLLGPDSCIADQHPRFSTYQPNHWTMVIFTTPWFLLVPIIQLRSRGDRVSFMFLSF